MKNNDFKINDNEFVDLFDEEFFVFDSDNLNDVDDKLYGFILTEKGIIHNKGNIPQSDLTGNGTYLYLNVNNDKISIFQDYNGSYGLYLYKTENYFAFSNSFLKLVEYLKSKVELTLNWDFAKLLIGEGLCSHVYKETLINEIISIPRNYIIHINKVQRCFEFEIIDFNQHSVNLNSIEALNILDNWFYKWINIIRSFKKESNNMMFDLTGGFDSRMLLIFALESNIDLNKVQIVSINNNNFKEDFVIANQIANEFNFKLNHETFHAQKTPFKDMSTTLLLSLYSELGFRNQINYYFYRYNQPIFSFTGGYGENIRGYNNKNPEQFLAFYEKRCGNLDYSLIEPAKRMIKASFNKIQNEYGINDDNSKRIVDLIYSECRTKNHFGKLAAQRYLMNLYKISPLSDMDLVKLKVTTNECDNEQLLMALIFLRFCPKLLDFKFDGRKKIDEKTIEYAKKINELKPFKKYNLDFVSGPELMNSELKKEVLVKPNYNHSKLNNYLKNIFYSRLFEMEFKKYFSTNIYNQISKSVETRTYFPLQDANTAIYIMKLVNDIGCNPLKQEQSMGEWFNTMSKINPEIDDSILPAHLEKIFDYVTARIDVINEGIESNNVMIVLNSDIHSNVHYPGWFKSDKGQGLSINSKMSHIHLKFKCVGDGILVIKLRGKDVRDSKNRRYPIYIDCTSFKINGESIFNNHEIVSHDSPYIFRKNVKDSEIVDFYLEWDSLSNLCEYPFN